MCILKFPEIPKRCKVQEKAQNLTDGSFLDLELPMTRALISLVVFRTLPAIHRFVKLFQRTRRKASRRGRLDQPGHLSHGRDQGCMKLHWQMARRKAHSFKP